MSEVFRKNELRVFVSLRSVYDAENRPTYLIQLIAEVNRVDIVAFQIREHDDLYTWTRVSLTALSSF